MARCLKTSGLVMMMNKQMVIVILLFVILSGSVLGVVRDLDELAVREQMVNEPVLVSEVVPIHTPTPISEPEITNNSWVNYHNLVFQPHYLGNVGLSYVTMEYEYIGDYFITAYCPEECGYRVYSDGTDNFPNGWITSTGTICHREEEWWNPSTCGINTKLLNYGDVFLIDGKVYVAEDTGYVTMPLIDLFMPSYEQMMQHGSHWTDVYKVSYAETEPVKGWHFDINKYWRKEE